MTFTSARGLRVAAALLTATAIAYGAMVWTAVPAQAHAQLVESTPAHGEALQVPPSDITMLFSEDLLELGGAVLVADSSEESWSEGDIVYDGPRVKVNMRSGMPDGRYEVRWRVVSADGHPISGVLSFTIGDVEDNARPTSATSTPTPEPSSGQGSADGDGTRPSSTVMRTVLIGLAGAVIASGGFWLGLRARRQGSRKTQAEPDSS